MWNGPPPTPPGTVVAGPSSSTSAAVAPYGSQQVAQINTTNGVVEVPPHANTNADGYADAAAADDLQVLVDEMRTKDFDSIRFATYRTACKLRFIQTKTNVHLVDIWNTIESFRENGLNAMAPGSVLKLSRLELLLSSLFHNLNKRLPTAQHVDTDKSIAMLLSFLLGAYDKQHHGRITIFAVKVALATLCAGKIVDKLRYIFSQISDSNGLMDRERFAEYLQQVLALPTAVFEGPTFGFNREALAQCFGRVTLNQFLDALMGDSCPPCLMWLPLLHRMAAVEQVYHPVGCDACQVRSFSGFRYKCQRCTAYTLCQACFWRGRTSLSHSNEHEMKEYSSYRSPTKQIAHSIQKSLQCVPIVSAKSHKEFPVRPQRPLDLTNIVPSTPSSARHQFHHSQSLEHEPLPASEWTHHLLPGHYGQGQAMDDEHKLIARYAAKLAGRTKFHHPQQVSGGRHHPYMGDSLEERAAIAQLEEENNELMREMAMLEQQTEFGDAGGHLSGLRERTAELEAKMREKQQLRRQLMLQLEILMSQLHAPSTMTSQSHQSLMPEQLGGIGSAISSAFAGAGVGMGMGMGMEGGVARAGSLPAAQLQGDLLQAAGAITSNMSQMVRELQASAAVDDSDGPVNINGNGDPHHHHHNGGG